MSNWILSQGCGDENPTKAVLLEFGEYSSLRVRALDLQQRLKQRGPSIPHQCCDWVGPGTHHTILTECGQMVQPFRAKVVPQPETRPSRQSIIEIFSLLCLVYNKHHLSHHS